MARKHTVDGFKEANTGYPSLFLYHKAQGLDTHQEVVDFYEAGTGKSFVADGSHHADRMNEYWDDLALSLSTNLWRGTSYQGNGPWRDEKAGLIAQKGAAGQAGITADGLWLPGVSGNYASCPDAAALRITGDLDIRIPVGEGFDWSPSSFEAFGGKWTSGQYAYLVGLFNTGRAALYLSSDGTTATAFVQTSVVVPSATRELRVTYRASDQRVQFFGDDVQIGTDQTHTVTSIFAGTAALSLGANSGGSQAVAGTVEGLDIYDGIDGTLVASPDFAAATPGALTVTDDEGNVFTINQSADGSDDPTFLDYAGTKWVRFSGVASNYISTPDSAALSVIGDIDLRAYGTLRDLTPSTNPVFFSKDNTTTQRSYNFFVKSTGHLRFQWSPTGTGISSADSTVTLATAGLSVDTKYWFRVTFDVDNGSSDADIKFWYSTDNATWTQIGATVNPGATQSIFDSTTELRLGVRGDNNQPYDGDIYQAQIYDGIDGTLVADFNIERDFSDHSTLTSSTTGEEWTFNRDTATTGLKLEIVTTDDFAYDGGDVMIFTPPSLFTGSAWSYVLPFRCHTQAAANSWLVRMNGSGSSFIDLYQSTTANQLVTRRRDDGGTSDTATNADVSIYDGELHVAVVVYDGSSLTVYVDSSTNDGTPDASIGSGAITSMDADGGYVGAQTSGAGSAANFRAPALAFAGVAFTPAQVDAICAQLIARNP